MDYPVVVGSGALSRLPELVSPRLRAHRWAVISDATVAALYGDAVLGSLEAAGQEARLFTFPPGERQKTRSTWAELTDALVEAGFGRDSAVVALGGGVTGDLAGFVAATFLRGVPVIQVPTSLVAMVDASVGGKTGVDVPAGKNLVGAFHPPRLVLADPETASTLPRRERAQGLVEALKHGAILDERYFDDIEASLPRLLEGEIEATERTVFRSVELKAAVVGEDEREAGYRQILNFGHTIGHALEAASSYELPHGSAVAMGMILEARLGERLGVTEAATSGRLRRATEALGLPAVLDRSTDPTLVSRFLGADKKRLEGRVRFVLLRRLGSVDAEGGWSRSIPQEEVRAVLEEAGAGGRGRR